MKLTEKQKKFLDALSGEASGEIKTALQIAGYEDTSYYAVVKSLRQEIIDTANTMLQNLHLGHKNSYKYWKVISQYHR